MRKILINCPLCNSKKNNIVYSSKTYNFLGPFFDIDISQCQDCFYVFQSSAYNETYEKVSSLYYENYEPYSKFRKKEKKTNTDKYEKINNKLFSYINNKDSCSILEIGSGNGELLQYLKKQNATLEVCGVEPASYDFLVPTKNTFFNSKLFDNKFNIVILRHVLEHIKYPKIFLEELEKCLLYNSILYIEVPSLHDNLENYNEDFVFEHVSYFDVKSLKRIFKNYKTISIENDNHISILLQKDTSNGLDVQKGTSVFNDFKDYSYMKQKLLLDFSKKIKKGDNICFYGLGHYFKVIFYELFNYIKDLDIEIFLCDSAYYLGEIEIDSKKFRLINFDDMIKCQLIVLSAGNLHTRKKMKEQVFKNKKDNTYVLNPWCNLSS